MSGEVTKSKVPVSTSVTGVGVGTLTQVVTAVSDFAVSVTGTFVATLLFEGTIDDLDVSAQWLPISLRPADAVADTTRAVSASAPNIFFGDVAMYNGIRVRCSAWTSGTVVVKAIKAYR